MRKNTIIGLIVFISLFSLAIFNPKEIFAGTHSCSFTIQSGGCSVSNNNCSTNETPDTNYCRSLTTASACNNAPATNCLSTLPSNGCTPKGFFGCDSGYFACTDNATCCNPQTLCTSNTGTNTTTPGCSPYNGIFCSGSLTFCQVGTNKFCCNTPQDCSNLSSNSGLNTLNQQDPTAGCGTTAISTAIGCIDFHNTDSFVGVMLKWGVGISGGVAFLLILMGAFTVMTSMGNPERLKDGHSIINSATSGLFLLILCIFILKFIGIDILGLNAFGFGP